MKNEIIKKQYGELQEFIDGDFFRAHEYPLDDPGFREIIFKLKSLVNELAAALMELD